MRGRGFIAWVWALLLAVPSVGAAQSRADMQSLRAEISACWNIGALSERAAQATVVVRVSLTPDAVPISDTITMIEFDAVSEAAATEAFVAARRAIIRCGQKGFTLPKDDYAAWKNIEMTFDPGGVSQ